MTHLYTLLVRGTVISGRDEPDVTAIAWAEDTVIALGSDDDIRAASRGDSHLVDLEGACVVPLGAGADACWPTEAVIEVGGPADLAILPRDPRRGGLPAGHGLAALALFREGRLVTGSVTGSSLRAERGEADRGE